MSFRLLNVWKKPKEDYLMAHYHVELRLNTVLLEQDAGRSLACGLQGVAAAAGPGQSFKA